LNARNRKETQKIAEYFNPSTRIGEYVNKITNGLFQRVSYNSLEGKFELTKGEDTLLRIEQLSQGELSQLYFAIRLALGSKCIDKGFLVMEEPFLSSDDERMEEQLRLLKNFVNMGWQIIGLTGKDQVKKKLLENGGRLVGELKRII